MAETEKKNTEVATADLPSGDAIPVAGPSPSPVPKPLPLKQLIAAAPSNIDAFLARLQRCLSTPQGVDTTLLFICYSTRLSSSIIKSATQPALRASAEKLLALASSLPPSTTLLFSSKAFPFSPSAATALALAQRLQNLSALLSDIRAFLRLWGLLNMYFWARRLVLRALALRRAKASGESKDKAVAELGPPMDRVETSIAWSQLVACVVFQSLENVAYLGTKGVLPVAPATQGKFYRLSAAFWGSFVGIEIFRLLRESHKRSKRTARERIGNKTVAEVEREEREYNDTWRKTLVRQLAWFPLTIHWSLEQGLVSDLTVGLLASIPGTIQMRDLWKRSASA